MGINIPRLDRHPAPRLRRFSPFPQDRDDIDVYMAPTSPGAKWTILRNGSEMVIDTQRRERTSNRS